MAELLDYATPEVGEAISRRERWADIIQTLAGLFVIVSWLDLPLAWGDG
jgi:hypothetical protein